MVVDTSALMAILWDEDEAQKFRNAIKLAPSRLLSASTAVEAGLVVLGRKGDAGLAQMEALVGGLRLAIVPLSADHARLAVDAFRRFGKGRHPAGLNFGDCMSYALAKATDLPLLFKGDDFSRTDVQHAV